MKFDQILILCEEGFVNGMANANLRGDEWRPHIAEIFPLVSPGGR